MPSKMHIRAEAVGEEGWGIGHHEGFEVRVFDLLPGEEAWVQSVHQSRQKNIIWANIKSRVGEVSSQRVAPQCPAYGECGGCAWQHMSVPAQHDEKRQRVERALAKALGSAPEIEGPEPSSAYGYRNKGKYVFGLDGDEVVLGAYRPRSHSIVSTLGCQIVEPAIDDIAQRLRVAVEQRALPIYVEKASETGLRYAILRCNAEEQVLLVLVCTSDTDQEALLALARDCMGDPRICGVVRCDNDQRSGALFAGNERMLYGEALVEEVAGVQVKLGAQAFWQLNRSQAARAYQDLSDAIGPPGSTAIVELYCGVGGIAFTLARAGHKVLGVERDAEAVQIAARAAQDAGLASLLQFQCGDAESLGVEQLAGAETLVVDPPRKGLGRATLDLLCAAKPACIAYLSCGPESLASDLAVLAEVGYRIERIKLYDFMPGTAQVETLVILRRGETFRG